MKHMSSQGKKRRERKIKKKMTKREGKKRLFLGGSDISALLTLTMIQWGVYCDTIQTASVAVSVPALGLEKNYISHKAHQSRFTSTFVTET